jgi:hypothetical protein
MMASLDHYFKGPAVIWRVQWDRNVSLTIKTLDEKPLPLCHLRVHDAQVEIFTSSKNTFVVQVYNGCCSKTVVILVKR